MKMFTILLMAASLAFLGCGDDDNDSSTAGTAGATGEGGAAGAGGSTEPTMGPGCYSGPPNHMCDCSIAEEDCAEPQIWTDTCPCGEAGTGHGEGEGHADREDAVKVIEIGAISRHFI